MTISFDLDGTLIPLSKRDFLLERQNFLSRLFGIKVLRHGSKQIFKILRKQKHAVGIYTTSYRPVWMIRLLFLCNGIRLDFVVNEKINRHRLNNLNISSSKYPPAFNIDLHIDDLDGVLIESEKYKFDALIIKKDDLDWVKKIEYRCLGMCKESSFS